MILQFCGNKLFRQEGLLQLLFLLSLLRKDPNSFHRLPDVWEFESSLGSSLGQITLPSSFIIRETHPKSLDRVLVEHQRNIINDLNSLGNFVDAGRSSSRDIQAYLHAESSLNARSPDAEDGVYISGPPSSEIRAQDFLNRIGIEDDSYNPNWDVEYDLMFQELECLEAIWKQDIDLGIPREVFDGDYEADIEKETPKMDLSSFSIMSTKEKDFGIEPDSSSENEFLKSDKPLSELANYTRDRETGEYWSNTEDSDCIARDKEPLLSSYAEGVQGTPASLNETDSLSSPSPLHFDFSLDDVLRISEIGPAPTSDKVTDTDYSNRRNSSGVLETDSGCGDSTSSEREESEEDSSATLDELNDRLDDMIQASQLHSHHPRAIQGRLGGLVRSGSMEQRWHDLASLLSLPSPDHPHHQAQSPPTPTMASHATSPIHSHAHGGPPHHPPPPVHHPHNTHYSSHEGAGATVAGSASAVSSVGGPSPSPGVPRGILLHGSPLQPPLPDHTSHNITYSNSMGASSHLVASSMNLTNSSDLVSDHHYKMETSSAAIPPDMMYYQQNTSTEMNQSTDGFLSSILNDEDLQLMDISMTDYNNGNSYRYQEDPQRLPHGAQKKHHMYGKRYVQDSPHGGHGNMVNANSSVGVSNNAIGGGYHHYPPQSMPMDGTPVIDPEMKYSCSNDFRTTPEVPGGSSIENIQHNHTYHMSSDGPSGITRQHARDKKVRKSEHQRHLTRDEKKAEAMRLPITCEDIINLPMDEFNERISKHDLSEGQLSLIRDIRRRGKNKVAAQNCRKRKLDQIIQLAEEVKIYQYKKSDLESQLDHLQAERERVRHKHALLYKHIFQSLRDQDGNPYSPHKWSLQQAADGNIHIVPRSSHPLDHIKSRHSKE